MRIPSFVIKSLIKGFGSLGLVSGGSVGGWYIYDSVIDPIPKIKELKINNYFYPPRRNSCWKEFFPNVYLSKGKINPTGPTPHNNAHYEPDKKNSAATDKEEGCTVMKYFGRTTKENNKAWAFESETVIKNEKIGVIAWLEINSLESNNQKYQIYFLEKDDKKDKWSVKFGFISQEEVPDLKKINSPNEKIKLSYSDKKWSSTTDNGYYKYYGKWKSDKNKEKKFLDGLLEPPKLEKFCAKYIYKDGKLYNQASSQDKKEILKKWFNPFKDKKGEWM